MEGHQLAPADVDAAKPAPLQQRTQRTSHNRRAPIAAAAKRPAAPPLSEYEVKRARNVEENEQVLAALGIEPAVPRAPVAAPAAAEAASSASAPASSAAAPKAAAGRGRISESALWTKSTAAAGAPPPLSPVAGESWEDDCACLACGWDDDQEGNQILLCEGTGCHAAYHQRCLAPPLRTIPADAWHCPRCVEARRAGSWRGAAHDCMPEGRTRPPRIGRCFQVSQSQLASPQAPTAAAAASPDPREGRLEAALATSSPMRRTISGGATPTTRGV